MIIRVFRAQVHEGKQAEFEQFFRNIALPKVKSHIGLVDVIVGTPIIATQNEFLMVTIWRDINALKGFAGDNWEQPVIDPAEVHLLKNTFLYHYVGVDWGGMNESGVISQMA